MGIQRATNDEIKYLGFTLNFSLKSMVRYAKINVQNYLH